MNFTTENVRPLNRSEEAEEEADMLSSTNIQRITDTPTKISSSEQSQRFGEIEEACSASRCEMATESTPLQGERGRHVSISFNSEKEQKHSEITSLETIFTRLTDTFAAALRQVATENTLRTNGNKAGPPPEFRGLEHESAQLFIEKMEDYYQTNNISDYPTKLAIITDQLKGEARRWFEPYKFLVTQYATFTERLRTKFDSVESITQATARLYGDKQQPEESVAVFITKKMCLFNRVDNGKLEVIKTGIVLDQLRPEIRSRLRGQHIRSLEDLVTVASQIEGDLQDISHSRALPTVTERQQKEPNHAIPPTTIESYVNRNHTGPPSPCRFCPGNQWHYHSECPNRPITARNQPRAQNNSLSGNERNQQWRDNASTSQPNQEQYQARPPRETLRRTAEFPDEPYSEPQRQGNQTWTEDPAGRSSSPSNSSNDGLLSKKKPIDTSTQTERIDNTIDYIKKTEELLPLPRIRITIGEKSYTALVDSGATRNIIKSTLARGHQHEDNPRKFGMACGDDTVVSRGITQITFFVNHVPYQMSFQILDELNEDLILGAPFLHNGKAVMDYQRRCLYVGTEDRQTVFWDQSNHQELIRTTSLHPDVHIPEEFKSQLQSLFEEFADRFSDVPMQATTITTRHRINLTSDLPVNIKPYPMSPHKKIILYQQVKEMLEAGVIEPSSAPYSSPPVIIERPGKKPRFCVDYRRLNEITEDEASVLPKIYETIKDLGNARYFTLLDLKSGYWQVPMAHGSKPYTTFTTPDGAAYQFNVMPFGLKTAPCTFQKLMTRDVLTGYLHHFTQVYLDDIIIYSPDMVAHRRHLRLVLERLRMHNLKISPGKCNIATQELDYLGHRIRGHTTTPQDKHILSIQNFPSPTTKRQLQSFLGLLNWIREYLPNVAMMTRPLTQLLSKEMKFRWTRECQEAFNTLKTAASQPLTLHRPDFTKTFILQTDASLQGISAVLYQLDEEGNRRIVSYASSTLTPSEKKYHVNELECLSLVTYVKKYQIYLQDRPFVVRTDNRSLLWLNKHIDSKTKFTRWSLLLQEYSFRIEHCPGRENVLADFLSRNPDSTSTRPDMSEERMLPPTLTPLIEKINLVTHSALYEKVVEAQRKSRNIRRLKEKWTLLQDQGAANPDDQRFFENHRVYDDVLWRVHDQMDKVVVPKAMIVEVIAHFHDTPEASHPGRDETLRNVSRHYHCRNMPRIVGKYLRNCLICHATKARQLQPQAPLKSRSPTTCFEVISIDILGPFKPSTLYNNRYIVLAEDVFSKWIEAKAYPEVKGKTVVQFLEETIVNRFGLPRSIISDNGGHFKSGHYTQWCLRNHVTIFYSAPYHQRANPVERRVQELKKVLRSLTFKKPEKTWDRYLSRALFVLRTRRNAATGQTPAFTVLGYELPQAGEWDLHMYIAERRRHAQIPRTQRIQEIRTHQAVYQRRYAPANQLPPVTFQEGDRVMAKVLRPHKDSLLPVWTGPHQIISKLSEEMYRILRGTETTEVYVDDLRPAPREDHELEFHSDTESDPRSDETSDDNSSEGEEPLLELESGIDKPPTATKNRNDSSIIRQIDVEPHTHENDDDKEHVSPKPPPRLNPAACYDAQSGVQPQPSTSQQFPGNGQVTRQCSSPTSRVPVCSHQDTNARVLNK